MDAIRPEFAASLLPIREGVDGELINYAAIRVV